MLFLPEGPHQQPVDCKEDDNQKGACIQKPDNRQGRICSREQAMQCSTKIAQQAEQMNGAKRLFSNLLPEVKRECDQQQDVETDDP